MARWIEEGYLTAQGVPMAAVLYLEIADLVAEIMALAIERAHGETRPPRAVLDPFAPSGSTADVNFQTTKPVWMTDARRSHVNAVVLDSDWEAELARVLEAHTAVTAYAKNQGMGFDVPYRMGSVVRRYIPDFLVRLDDGRADPLHLVLETKGFRGLDAQLKAETMATLWVPGVNALGQHGRWAFAEFREVFAISEEFARLVERLRAGAAA